MWRGERKEESSAEDFGYANLELRHEPSGLGSASASRLFRVWSQMRAGLDWTSSIDIDYLTARHHLTPLTKLLGFIRSGDDHFDYSAHSIARNKSAMALLQSKFLVDYKDQQGEERHEERGRTITNVYQRLSKTFCAATNRPRARLKMRWRTCISTGTAPAMSTT